MGDSVRLFRRGNVLYVTDDTEKPKNIDEKHEKTEP